MSEQTAFQLVAGHPTLDFINTLDNRFHPAGPRELLSSYDELLQFTTETGLLTPEQSKHLRARTSEEAATRSLQAAQAERELLARVFYALAEGQRPDLGSVNRILQMILPHRRIKEMDGKIAWTWEGITTDPESPLRMLVFEAADLLTSPRIGYMRSCATPTCKWLFLDSSKNHNRRWCNMRVCGNRTKARRHYQKAATVGSQSAVQDPATEG